MHYKETGPQAAFLGNVENLTASGFLESNLLASRHEQLSALTINTPSVDTEHHPHSSSRCKQHTMQVLVACCFFSLLLTCANAGSCHCSVPPLPSLDTNTMLVKLQPYLDQLDQKVQSILKWDNSTGGLVLSIVYRNETIWTKGYGLINMSGQLSISSYSKYRVDLIFFYIIMLVPQNRVIWLSL